MSVKALTWLVRSALWACLLIAAVGVGVAELRGQTLTVMAGATGDTAATRPMASLGVIRCTFYQPVTVGGNASDGWTFTPAGDPIEGAAANTMMPQLGWEYPDGTVVYNQVMAVGTLMTEADHDYGYDTDLWFSLMPGDPSTESGRVYIGSRSKTSTTPTFGWVSFPETACRFGVEYGCLSGSEHNGHAGPVIPFVQATRPEPCVGGSYNPCTPLDTWVLSGALSRPPATGPGSAINLGSASFRLSGSGVSPSNVTWQTCAYGSTMGIGIRLENSGVNEITIYSSTGFRARTSGGIQVRLNSDGTDFPWVKYTIYPGESPWGGSSTVFDPEGIIDAINELELSNDTNFAAIIDLLSDPGSGIDSMPEHDAEEQWGRLSGLRDSAETELSAAGVERISVPAPPDTVVPNPVYTFTLPFPHEWQGEWIDHEIVVDMTWYEPARTTVRNICLVPMLLIAIAYVWREFTPGSA